MRWREALHPVGMHRVALLAPREALRDLLVNVADEGTVALDDDTAANGAGRSLSAAAARLQRLPAGGTTAAALAPTAPDLDRCEQAGRVDLIAGEAQLEQRSAQALMRDSVAALTGWMPTDDMAAPRRSSRSGGRRGRADASSARGAATDPAAAAGGVPRVRPAGRDLRDRSVRGREPVADCRPGLRRHVRHDVRRRRPRRAARPRRSRDPDAMVVEARTARAGLAVPGGCGPGEHGLRRAVRRVLRPDTRRPSGLARAAGPSGTAARIGGCGRRGAAGRRLRAGHGQSLPRRRLAPRGVRAVRPRRRGAVPRHRRRGRRRLPRPDLAGSAGRCRDSRLGSPSPTSGCSSRPAVAAPARPRPASSCSTWFCGSAQTWSASPGSLRSV